MAEKYLFILFEGMQPISILYYIHWLKIIVKIFRHIEEEEVQIRSRENCKIFF